MNSKKWGAILMKQCCKCRTSVKKIDVLGKTLYRFCVPIVTVSTRYALRSLAQIVTAGFLPTIQTFLTFLRKIKQLYT